MAEIRLLKALVLLENDATDFAVRLEGVEKQHLMACFEAKIVA